MSDRFVHHKDGDPRNNDIDNLELRPLYRACAVPDCRRHATHRSGIGNDEKLDLCVDHTNERWQGPDGTRLWVRFTAEPEFTTPGRRASDREALR